jgi:TP901 family phage tail tape measure protein
MAVKTIETQAVISAKDMTGGVFGKVAQKLKQMEEAARRADSAASRSGHASERRVEQTDKALARGAQSRAFAATASAFAAEKALEKVNHAAKASIETYKEFDDLVRYQRPIAGITPAQQKPMIDQAIHLGGSTMFNDIQVLEAQLSLIQRGVKAEFVIPITEAAAHFGQAMNVDLPQAAKTLESAIFSTGQHMEDAAEAVKNANRTTDVMVKTAKIGGLNNEDLQMLFKFGGASGHVAGLSLETIGALGAMMSRGGISGDQAGVAIRSISGSLVAPTAQAMTAMEALGLRYGDYTKMPGGMSADNLNNTLMRRLGGGLNASQKARMQELLGDPEKVADRATFVQEATSIVGETFGKGKDGKLRAADSKAIAKTVGDFYKASIESIDTERLLRDIIDKGPTAAQANAIFTKQQGGRFMTAAQYGLHTYDDFRGQLVHVPAGFARGIGEERNAGFAGAKRRFDGAVKNVETKIGRANDDMLTGFYNVGGQTLQHIAEADDRAVAFGTQFAWMNTAATTLKAGMFAAGKFGLTGPAAQALNASPWGLGLNVALGGYHASLFAKDALWNNPAIRKDLEDNPMLGAMSGDYAFAAGIMDARENAERFAAQRDAERRRKEAQADFTFGSRGGFSKEPLTEVQAGTLGRVSNRAARLVGGDGPMTKQTIGFEPIPPLKIEITVHPSSSLIEAAAKAKEASVQLTPRASIGSVGETHTDQH